MDAPRLLDEASRPGLRQVWGALLAHADAVDVAVTRIRLATLDFGPAELARVQTWRVLVADLSAATLDAEAHAAVVRVEARVALGRLLGLLEAGRLEVRAAPLGGWSPDFSVFHRGRAAPVALVGPHRFEPPAPLVGPWFVSGHEGDDAHRVADGFGSLWSRGHDVGPALRSLLAPLADPVAEDSSRVPKPVLPQRIARVRRRHPAP